MSDRSKIEWTDASWNPVRAFKLANPLVSGWHCEHVSEGCRNCYAEAFNRRLGTGLDYGRPERARVEIELSSSTLGAPLHWKRPRKIFVGSMTDLFGDWVADEMLDRIFAVMALCPQHSFQVLTKRPERMKRYIDDLYGGKRNELHAGAEILSGTKDRMLRAHGAALERMIQTVSVRSAPHKNVLLGVSTEDQATADRRIPILLNTPAAVRFLSAEPLLGPIDLRRSAFVPWIPHAARPAHKPSPNTYLDWVIVGGESGREARPMHPDWARGLRDQCTAAGVAFFFKQWGEWSPHRPVAGGDLGGDVRAGRVKIVHPTGQSDVEVSDATGGRNTIPGSRYMALIGKKAAGRDLDGVEHNGFPEVRHA
jgi:protein gp37